MNLAELAIVIHTESIDTAITQLKELAQTAKKVDDATSNINVKFKSSAQSSIETVNALNDKFKSLGASVNQNNAAISSAISAYESVNIAAKKSAQLEKDLAIELTSTIKRLEQERLVNTLSLIQQKVSAEKQANDQRISNEEIANLKILASYRKLFDEISVLEAKKAQGTFANFGSTASRSSNSYGGSNQSFSNVAGLLQQTTATQALASANIELGNSANRARSHYDELHRILGKTHDMLIRMAAYRGISLVFGLPGDILDVNVRMESLRVQLEGITGSVGQAKAVFKELLALDIKTPFDIEGLAQTWIRLKNYGLEPTKEVMKSLTDGVARLGGGTDILNRVSLQLGQAWAKNKLQLQDMKPMMEAGIPVLQILADKMHTNAGAILEMSKAGTIGQKELLLLLKGIEEWAPNASIRAMDTLKGQISNLTTAWIQFEDALLNTKGEAAVKSMIKGISDTLFNAIKYIDEIITSITIFASILAVQAVSGLIAYADKQILANAAARTGAVAMAELTSSAKLLNIGLAALVGWEIGAYLNKFETIRRVANDTLYSVLILVENLAYGYERLAIAMSKGTSEEHWVKLNELKKAHIEALKPLEDLISADNTYVKGANDVTESVKYKTEAAKKDLELLEQSEKATKAQVKALEALERVNKSIADAENARIDAKVKTVGILAGLSVKQYEDEYKYNQDAFKNLEIGQQAYLDKQMQLIEAIKSAKLKAINEETVLIKSKTNEQIDNVQKALEVIHTIESGNGRPGQEVNRTGVNMDNWTLGAGQAKISTLRDPGVKGMLPYSDIESIDKIKGNYDALVEYVKTHQADLTAWSDKYFTQLVVKYGSVMGALKQYGEGTEAYNKKFISMYNDHIGATKQQIALDQTQMDNELKKKGIIEESLASQSKLKQQLIQDESNLVKALKSKYETPDEKANTEIERLNKLRSIYDESVFPMKLYNQALMDIEVNRIKGNKSLLESIDQHKELDSILRNLNKETLNASKGDKSLYLDNVRENIADAAIRDNKSLLDLPWQMEEVSKAYDKMITAKQTADIVNTIKNGFSGAFKDILAGTKSFGEAFKNIFDNAIGKIIDISLQNLMTGFQKVFDGAKDGWGQVFSSLAILAASSISSLFGKEKKQRQLSPSETGNSSVLGTGAMHIADTFSRDLGYEYQSQTIIRFNKSLNDLSSGMITGIKAGIDAFGSQLASLSVVQSVSSFMKPITDVVTGVYTAASNLISSSLTSIGNAIGVGAASFSQTVSSAWSAGIASIQTTTAGAVQAADAAFAQGASVALKTAGQVVAVVGAMYQAFTYFSGLGDMLDRGNVLEIITSTTTTIGAVIAAYGAVTLNPIVGVIGGIIMAVSALVDLFNKPRIPNVWMNNYNPDASGAPFQYYDQPTYTTTGNKSAYVGEETRFGMLVVSTHEMSLSAQDMVNSFGELLSAVKSVDENLYQTIMRVDAAVGETGKTMDYYNRVLVGDNRIATKQNVSDVNTGNMLSARYDWIVNQLDASGSQVGQYINAWFDVITNKFISVSKDNSMFVLGVIDSLSKNIESFMEFPLSLVKLIGQSVKSTSIGGTPDSVMAEITDVFNTYMKVKSGLVTLGMGGDTGAINEGIVTFLSSVNSVGFAVKDAGINLLAYAIAMQKVSGSTTDAVALLSDANAKFANLKAQGLDNSQITAYIGSFGLMANMFAEAKVSFTGADLDTAALNIHNLAQASSNVAKEAVNHAIATAKLTNVTRESAIATLVKNKTLDEATVAESEYGVSIQKVTKDLLSNLSFIQQLGFVTGKTLGDLGISADTWQRAAGNIINVFGDMETAMKTLDNIVKAFLSNAEYAQYNLDSINRAIANMQDIVPQLKGFTEKDITNALKSGLAMTQFINVMAEDNGELAKSIIDYVNLMAKKIELEKQVNDIIKNTIDLMNNLRSSYSNITQFFTPNQYMKSFFKGVNIDEQISEITGKFDQLKDATVVYTKDYVTGITSSFSKFLKDFSHDPELAKAAIDLSNLFIEKINISLTTVDYAFDALSKKINDNLTSLQTIAGNLKTALGATTVESEALSFKRRKEAQDIIKQAALKGDINNPRLADALLTVAKPGQQFYSTFVEYARDQGRVNADISKLYNITNDKIDVYQAQLDAAKEQVDLLKGIDTSLKSINTLSKDFIDVSKIAADARGIDRSTLKYNAEYDKIIPTPKQPTAGYVEAIDTSSAYKNNVNAIKQNTDSVIINKNIFDRASELLSNGNLVIKNSTESVVLTKDMFDRVTDSLSSKNSAIKNNTESVILNKDAFDKVSTSLSDSKDGLYPSLQKLLANVEYMSSNISMASSIILGENSLSTSLMTLIQNIDVFAMNIDNTSKRIYGGKESGLNVAIENLITSTQVMWRRMNATSDLIYGEEKGLNKDISTLRVSTKQLAARMDNAKSQSNDDLKKEIVELKILVAKLLTENQKTSANTTSMKDNFNRVTSRGNYIDTKAVA